MKHVIKILFAVLFASLFAACGTTRKIAKEQKQQQITQTVTGQQTQQTAIAEAVNTTVTSVDLSTAVIDFTKVEYEDGTSTVIADTTVQADGQHIEREQTEPPNAQAHAHTRNIKSVTSGRVTFKNDKKTQIDTEAKSDAVSENKSSVQSDTSADVQTSVNTEEVKGRGFFHYSGIVIGIIILIVVAIVIIRVIDKKRRWRSD